MPYKCTKCGYKSTNNINDYICPISDDIRCKSCGKYGTIINLNNKKENDNKR